MLENTDVFNDEFMVDELIGFQGAATETTHNVFQTILASLMKDQDSLDRVRDEFASMVTSLADPSINDGTPLTEKLQKVVNVDSCFDLTH